MAIIQQKWRNLIHERFVATKYTESNRRTIIKRTFIGLGVFVSIAFIFHALGLRWNESTSYPTGLYQLTGKSDYQRGELILFCPPDNPALQMALERQYLRFGLCNGGFEPVIKRIVGVGKERVTFTDVITINQQRLPNTHRLQHDGSNRPLPQLDDFTLPDNTFFVISDHKPASSFDSRYYGAVPRGNVIGGIKPLFLLDGE
jgi:conjugative transfer signal peptidase TraF